MILCRIVLQYFTISYTTLHQANHISDFMHSQNHSKNAFTLIELSIVLVIIGLIVGGILVGRDLITAAGVRAQIAQIDEFQQATNTFRGKYGYLPGDVPDPLATQIGFAAVWGDWVGDGDGTLEGNGLGGSYPPAGYPWFQAKGELTRFWNQLSTLAMIKGSYTVSMINTATTENEISQFIPVARIRSPGHVVVWSGGPNVSDYDNSNNDGKNYFTVSGVTLFGTGTDNTYRWTDSKPLFTVSEAYNYDKKVDDGLPSTGHVLAFWLTTTTFDNAATAASTTTCYDNGNVASGQYVYSTTQNGGRGMNCGLSIRFQ